MSNVTVGRRLAVFLKLVLYAALLFCSAVVLRADEPYARSKDYDLQHSKVSLHFDLDQKKVIGDVTHSVSPLREGLEKISFDSVGLQIQSVKINKGEAKFSTTDTKLIVDLPKPGKIGEKYEIEIKYEGKPTKGLYFILPDKDYPNRPKQVWSQGESEDTRYYLPTYDYPNDRLTTETILTVPADWQTVSNGKLISTTDAGNGMKTWTWRESQPSSTYLFTVVAGEFAEVKDSWRNLPVTYYAPKDRGDSLKRELWTDAGNDRIIQQETGRGLSVGKIRAGYGGRFRGWRNGKLQRHDKHGEFAAKPKAGARISHR